MGSDAETTTVSGRSPALDGSWVLLGLLGASRGAQYRVRLGVTTIGKIADADIRLTDSGVSRNHAELRLSELGTMTLVDVGSTNGTFVGDTRIEQRVVHHGDILRFGADAVLVLHRGPARDDHAARLASLTAREREVARLIARGNTNNEIAKALAISRRTVDRHVANALGRLKLRSRVELARLVFGSTDPLDQQPPGDDPG